ncbi:kinesin motor domain-containing protein [Cystoisospora suis]|uniref:Kinesin motor domain-containing protein n=1 Tax=Cystoisospora suis TaxID=483139 RepID=A0A2C6KXF3_9APIC|nr:kinesin motor domain-containing protein [Cystoisospora suis]
MSSKRDFPFSTSTFSPLSDDDYLSRSSSLLSRRQMWRNRESPTPSRSGSRSRRFRSFQDDVSSPPSQGHDFYRRQSSLLTRTFQHPDETSFGSSTLSPSASCAPCGVSETGKSSRAANSNSAVESAVFELITRAAEKAVEQALKDHYAKWNRKNGGGKKECGGADTGENKVRQPLPITEAKVRITPNHLNLLSPRGVSGAKVGGSLGDSGSASANGSSSSLPSFSPLTCRFSVLPNEADPEGGPPTLQLLETFHEDGDDDLDTLEGKIASFSPIGDGEEKGQPDGLSAASSQSHEISSSVSLHPAHRPASNRALPPPRAGCRNALWEASNPTGASSASARRKEYGQADFLRLGLSLPSPTATAVSPFVPHHLGTVSVPGSEYRSFPSPLHPEYPPTSWQSKAFSSHPATETSALRNFSGFSTSFFSKLVCIEGGGALRRSRLEDSDGTRERRTVSQSVAKKRGSILHPAADKGGEIGISSEVMTDEEQEDTWPDMMVGGMVSSTSKEHQLELRKLIKSIVKLWKLQRHQNALVNKLKEWARDCYLMSGKLPGRAKLISDLPGVRTECCRTRAAIREHRKLVSRQIASVLGTQTDGGRDPLLLSDETREELEGVCTSRCHFSNDQKKSSSLLSRKYPLGRRPSGATVNKEMPVIIGEKLDRICHLLTSIEALLNERDEDEALCEDERSQEMFHRRLSGTFHQVQVVQKQLVSLLEKEGKSVSLKSLLDDACPSLTTSTTAPGEGEEPTREYNKELQEGFSEESHLATASGQERMNTTDMEKDESALVTRSERDLPDNKPRPVGEGRQEKMLNGAGADVPKKQNTENEEEGSQTRQSSGADTVSTAASCSCVTSESSTSVVVNKILKQKLRDITIQRDALEERLRSSLARVDVQQEAIEQLVLENRRRLSELLTLRGSHRVFCCIYSSSKSSPSFFYQSMLSCRNERNPDLTQTVGSFPVDREVHSETDDEGLLTVSDDTTISLTDPPAQIPTIATRRIGSLRGRNTGHMSSANDTGRFYKRTRRFSPATLVAVATRAGQVIESTLRGGRAPRGDAALDSRYLRRSGSKASGTFYRLTNRKGHTDFEFDRVYADDEENSPAALNIFEDCCDLLQSVTKDGLNFCLVTLGPRTAAKTTIVYGAPPSLSFPSSLIPSTKDDSTARHFSPSLLASVSQHLGVAQLISHFIFEELETQCARLPWRAGSRDSGTKTRSRVKTSSDNGGAQTDKQQGGGKRGGGGDGDEEAASYLVHYSVLEIRHEQLSDGLVTDRRQAKKIDIKKDRKTGEVKVTNLVSRRAEKPEDLLAALGQISEKHFRELHAQDLGTEDELEVSEGSGHSRFPRRESKYGAASASHVIIFIHTEVHDPSTGSVWRGKIALADVATSQNSEAKAPFNFDSSSGSVDASGGFTSFLSLGRTEEEREAVCLNTTLASLRKIFISQRLKMRSGGCKGSGRDSLSASNKAGAVWEPRRYGDMNTRTLFQSSKLTKVLEDCLDTLYARAVLLVCLPNSGFPEFPLQEFTLSSTESQQNANR